MNDAEHSGVRASADDRAHEAARALALAGRLAEAALAYQRVLGSDPGDAEALNFIATQAMAQGRIDVAIQRLEKSLTHNPDDGPTLKNLGVAWLHAKQPAKAAEVLSLALERSPSFVVARLFLGTALERQGKDAEAVRQYYQAISLARSAGGWLDDATTPAPLRAAVKHATAYVHERRGRLLRETMASLRDRYGRSEMTRVERCLANFLGEIRISPGRSEQRPTFLYFPGLPDPPVFDPAIFEWADDIAARTDAIVEELEPALRSQSGVVPFLGANAGSDSSYLGPVHQDATAKWDGLFFYRHGKRHNDVHAACPVTSAILDSTTLVRIPAHAPEALFSLLGPGSHIRPHTGVTNTRIVTHLPLIVPPDCAIRIADHTHHWRKGECLMFDDTFEHEAWNRSDQLRVILLFDVWNPYMTDAERMAISDLVVRVGELNGEAVLAE